ncbi:hypothetical protein EAW55_13635 [Legionella jordanis]|uniref:Uncharacterized protein n=2 Tax=Legionella jordanis TaxID=456 RepID=A0A0W0VHA6_9GAMM|nr:hypothetical protein [Legionella jordanis]KTD19213.1 hypothetical protein Ljor_0010 [Legionella jordanis]RMW99850.1 hypothetical protein EAW55_13635 [Legionella jordanis]VEH12901.1 Uncharacterised protein [Legionella jordanis]HAT8714845.1 hypothetical protein [Legionella jordanis]
MSLVYLSSVYGLENDRPYQQMLEEVLRSDVVYPQDKGEIQLSFLPSYFNNREGKTTFFPLEIEYGLTDFWQIDALLDLYQINRPKEGPRGAGLGDVAFGTKYSFMNIAHTNYHAALIFDVDLPTGNINKGLTEGFIAYEPSVAFAKDFPSFHNSQFFGQTGFSFLQRIKRLNQAPLPAAQDDNEDAPAENEAAAPEPVETGSVIFEDIPAAHFFFLNLGYFLPVGNARYVIETNWITNTWNHRGDENLLYITPGIVWELAGGLELAVGSSFGLTRSSDKYDILLRATYEFELFEKTPMRNKPLRFIRHS